MTAITTLLMAMVPVIELRGAIPYGVIEGLTIPQAFLFAFIGNMIPVPFIILFTRKVFAWLRVKSPGLNSLVERLEQKALKHSNVVEKSEFFGLILLVAIPLPGTGAWTGALVASVFDMRLKRALPAITIGVLIAGIIVSWLTYGGSLAIS
jgi:uncharacterized membrane protein